MSVTFLVDLGSHTLKIGTCKGDLQESDDLFEVSHTSSSAAQQQSTTTQFACDEIPSLMGRQKITSLTQMMKNAQEMQDSIRFGADCLKQSDLLSLQPIITSQGPYQDWNSIETLLSRTLGLRGYREQQHQVDSGANLLLSENFSSQQRSVREKLAEIVFESLNFANFQFTVPASNILHSQGLTTGCVVDMGECSTTITPIVEGFIMSNAVNRSAIGGQTLLENFIKETHNNKGLQLLTTYEREVIARNMLMMRQPEVKRGIVPYKLAKKRSEGAFVLPDGTVIEMVVDDIKASLEQTFFDQSCPEQNLASQIVKCVDTDIDIDNREPLRQSIVVSGGTSLVPLFDSLLTREFEEKCPYRVRELQPRAAAERKLHSCQGMAILAQLGSDANRMLSREDYAELGNSILQ